MRQSSGPFAIWPLEGLWQEQVRLPTWSVRFRAGSERDRQTGPIDTNPAEDFRIYRRHGNKVIPVLMPGD
jgi:hypothetical protein